jgi:hypothetical protein
VQDTGTRLAEVPPVCAQLGAHDAKRNVATAPRGILLDSGTVKAVKQLLPLGMRLLGFKPLHEVLASLPLRHGHFVYPDDTMARGSTMAFAALHQAMLQREVAALVWVQPKNNVPMLGALQAQAEHADELGQLTPPGMHLLYLPFFDDIRTSERQVRQLPPACPDPNRGIGRCASARRLFVHAALPGDSIFNPHKTTVEAEHVAHCLCMHVDGHLLGTAFVQMTIEQKYKFADGPFDLSCQSARVRRFWRSAPRHCHEPTSTW